MCTSKLSVCVCVHVGVSRGGGARVICKRYVHVSVAAGVSDEVSEYECVCVCARLAHNVLRP